MASNSMKSLLKKVRSDLDWPILERPHNVPVIRIVSNASNKSHVFFMPDKLQNRSTDLDYLHELGHAYFTEKMHPVFSANSQFSPTGDKRQFMSVIPALNAACDWFIAHWQLQVAREELRKHLEESLPIVEEVLGNPTPPPLEVILDASLIIAQAIHYLDEPIDCGGALKTAVDAFLSVPPEQPSEENCVLLVNLLMATYTDQRVRFVNDGESHFWQIFKQTNASDSEVASISRHGEDS